MLYYQVQVICIFRESDWKIFSINCELSLTKEDFLRKVFDRLTRTEVETLVKISACQFCDTDDEVYPFLDECRGQIWFENGDLENRRIRDNYLQNPLYL